MRILTVPLNTAVLRSKSAPIQEMTPDIIRFLRDLGETLKNQRDPQGVGLSAIQVGRPIRAFATLLPSASKGPTNELRFYINPQIIDHSPDMTLGEDLVESNKKLLSVPRSTVHDPQILKPFLEGCLSIPEIYGPVLRWKWINAKAIVLSEKDLMDLSTIHYPLSTIHLDGLPARVFQHELDHLNGILFTDLTLRQGYQLYRQKEKGMVPMEM